MTPTDETKTRLQIVSGEINGHSLFGPTDIRSDVGRSLGLLSDVPDSERLITLDFFSVQFSWRRELQLIKLQVGCLHDFPFVDSYLTDVRMQLIELRSMPQHVHLDVTFRCRFPSRLRKDI